MAADATELAQMARVIYSPADALQTVTQFRPSEIAVEVAESRLPQ